MSGKKKWIVWAQFWTAHKPRTWGYYTTKAEAEDAARALNASPSGKYTDYYAGEKAEKQD